jgi:hypothetical protein
MFAVLGVMSMDVPEFPFRSRDLLPQFSQFVLRSFPFPQFPLPGKQIAEPLLEVARFSFHSGEISLFPASPGLQLGSLGGLQQFNGFLFQPLGLLPVSPFCQDRGFFAKGPGPVAKLVGFGGHEKSTAAEQKERRDYSGEGCALHFVTS